MPARVSTAAVVAALVVVGTVGCRADPVRPGATLPAQDTSAVPVPPATPGGAGPTLFVSPDGSDTAAGTRAAPLRTPQLAVDRLPAAGGTVELETGTYRRQRIVLAGRHDVVVRAAEHASPVLDAAGLVPPDGDSGLVEIHDGTRVTITGLALTGYRTRSQQKVPVGILVTGGGSGITISSNHAHDLGNDNATRGSMDTNAHGIAVYGDDPHVPVSALRISANEVDHLTLGASEAVVVNGNVDGWSITGNRVHDDDNIGIDAIGYEATIPGPARYTDVDRARNGVISGNVVTGISADGNPAYDDGGSPCHCADGIYVDGGRSIRIDGNVVRHSDIGLEVAAEDPRGHTDAVTVTGNTISDSAYVGLTIGGYAPDRGEAFDVTVRGNTLTGDDTLADGSPEILLQFKVHQTTITGNEVTATDAGDPELVQRVRAAGTTAQNADVVLDHNTYRVPGDPADAGFSWLGRDVSGLTGWQRASGQDGHSTCTTG